MRGISLTRCVVVALFAGALACARNQETGTARVEDDTTAMADTTAGVENPPGYQGMERDTTAMPQQAQEPVDTFLQQQGTNPRADTAGYRGIERPDTAGGHTDTTNAVLPDTTGMQRDTTRIPSDTSVSQPQWPSDTSRPGTDTSMVQPDTTR